MGRPVGVLEWRCLRRRSARLRRYSVLPDICFGATAQLTIPFSSPLDSALRCSGRSSRPLPLRAGRRKLPNMTSSMSGISSGPSRAGGRADWADGSGRDCYLVGGKRYATAAQSLDGTPVAVGTEVVIDRVENGVAYVESWVEVEQRL